mmetsp:Transcript_32910/g.84325  ORF Transcript_32910/g.84325 Transcript_32910/m.84325 type:complete len:213 (-) Transcript_32910:173-811(-)
MVSGPKKGRLKNLAKARENVGKNRLQTGGVCADGSSSAAASWRRCCPAPPVLALWILRVGVLQTLVKRGCAQRLPRARKWRQRSCVQGLKMMGFVSVEMLRTLQRICLRKLWIFMKRGIAVWLWSTSQSVWRSGSRSATSSTGTTSSVHTTTWRSCMQVWAPSFQQSTAAAPRWSLTCHTCVASSTSETCVACSRTLFLPARSRTSTTITTL